MALALILVAVFLVTKWLIEAVVLAIFGIGRHDEVPSKDITIINNYYSHTDNHLHVNQEEYDRLKKLKNEGKDSNSL